MSDYTQLAKMLAGVPVNGLEDAPQRGVPGPWIQPQLLAPGFDNALNRMILQRGEWGTTQDPIWRLQVPDQALYPQWAELARGKR